jgi:hypothetical protein
MRMVTLAIGVFVLVAACDGGWSRSTPSPQAQRLLSVVGECELDAQVDRRPDIIAALRDFAGAPECRGKKACRENEVFAFGPQHPSLCTSARLLVRKHSTVNQEWGAWFVSSYWLLVVIAVAFLFATAVRVIRWARELVRRVERIAAAVDRIERKQTSASAPTPAPAPTPASAPASDAGETSQNG